MTCNRFKPALALCAAALALPALGAQFGEFDLTGFVLDEYSRCDNCAQLENPQGYDPRGVLPVSTGGVAVNQPGIPAPAYNNLFLYMLSGGVTHEFDNAVQVEGRLTTRQRNWHADIDGEQLDEAFVGTSYPTAGSLRYGTQFTRSWSRADAFSYPHGLSDYWAESGAGYGVVRRAWRYATPEFEPSFGKIRFEATFARPAKEYPLNTDNVVYAAPPQPKLYEGFVQFSNERNLIEFVYQQSSGGIQSSFAEGGFFGAQGNTDSLAAAEGYQPPSERLWIVQGNFWKDEHWRFTYGLKRSWWSGLQQQCDFSTVIDKCFYNQGGFNYASDGRLHSAYEYDGLLGLSYVEGLWTYTAGAVRMNKAYTITPTEWGQSNTAIIGNLGIYRKIPNLNSHLDTSVYAGLSRIEFGRQGPPPLSLPGDNAFAGVDSRVSKSGNTVTIGSKIIF